MEAIPWGLLPILGPFGLAAIVLVSAGMMLLRALESGRLQTRGQVETQLQAEKAVSDLWQDAARTERAAREALQPTAEFVVHSLTAIRTQVERWE